MKPLRYLARDEQQIMPLFGGAFVENKPIPFPERGRTQAYSSLFYWAHLDALETSEFPLHPHEGFEIMTFVFEGALEHYDTASRVWTPLGAGGVQVIHAGSGVQHAERILKGTRMFQIWFDPDFSLSLRQAAEYAGYEAPQFVSATLQEGIEFIRYVGDGAVIESQTPGISIEKMSLKQGSYRLEREGDATYSYYLLSGEVDLNHHRLEPDGFLAEEGTTRLACEVLEPAELFVIKTPTKVPYPRFVERYGTFG